MPPPVTKQVELLRGPQDRVSDLRPDSEKLKLIWDGQAGANLLPQAGPWFTTDGPHRKINTYIPTPFNPLGRIGTGGAREKNASRTDEGERGNEKEMESEGADITVQKNQ